MLKTGKKLMAVLLSGLLVVCALPFVSIAATTPMVTISSNVTNGVEDENVEFTYEVIINGQAYNGTVEGSDSNEYTITDGELTMPYDVSASIELEDGDTYSVKRLAYSSGKYKPVEESEAKTGEIATTSYFVTINGGDKTEISKSEYEAATNNGAETSFKVYEDANGVKYSADEVSQISGYLAKENKTLNVVTSRSLDEYQGYYVNGTLEEHTITFDDVSCTHKKTSGYIAVSSFNNSLTGYLDGVADETKTKS